MTIPLVFLIEDNPDNLLYIKNILEHSNYRVVTAKNGKEGLRTLTNLEDLPSLIISDIMMPIMDGYDFYIAVSNIDKFSHIPFLFLSALDSLEDVRLAKTFGIDDYLTKPIDEDLLLATIGKKIRRTREELGK